MSLSQKIKQQIQIKSSQKKTFKSAWKVFLNDFEGQRMFEGAATLSYYFVLTLFPTLFSFFALIQLMSLESYFHAPITFALNQAPDAIAEFIEKALSRFESDKTINFFSLSILFSFWSATTGANALINQMDHAYKIKRPRHFVYQRLIALFLVLLMFAILVFPMSGYLIIDTFFVFFPREFRDQLRPFYDSTEFAYSVGLFLLTLSLAIIYYIAPNIKQRFKFVTPGSLICTIMLILTSLGFEFYIHSFGNYQKLYGQFTTVIILLLWLYLMGFVLILGAHINYAYYKVKNEK